MKRRFLVTKGKMFEISQRKEESGMKRRFLVTKGITFAIVMVVLSMLAVGCPPRVVQEVIEEPLIGYVYEHLRVGWPREIVSLDPLGYERLGRPELNVHELIFDHLFYRDAETMELVPHLATGYEALDDYTWRIFLREGVTFHNGNEFNAYDVKFSIECMICPEVAVGLSTFLGDIERVEIIDEFTVDIHTRVPLPTLLARLVAYPLMVDAETRRGVDREVFAAHPIGTGAFRFVEWRKGDRIVLERNVDYWEGVPKIKNLTLYIIPDAVTRVAALEAGEIDIAVDVPAHLAPKIKGVPGLEVTAVPSVRVQWMWLRTDERPFDDKRVRQAVNYAVNVEEIIEELVYGFGEPFGQAVPDFFFGGDPDIKPFPYDPVRARELLAEAGFPDGFSTRLTATAVDGHDEIAMAVAGFLGEVGIDVRVDIMESAAMRAAFHEGRMAPMHYLSWGNWSLFDIDGTLPFVFGSEGVWSYFSNEAIDRIIEEMATVDVEKRLRLAKEAARIIREEAPMLFMFTQYDIHGKKAFIEEFSARRDNTVRFEWVME